MCFRTDLQTLNSKGVSHHYSGKTSQIYFSHNTHNWVFTLCTDDTNDDSGVKAWPVNPLQSPGQRWRATMDSRVWSYRWMEKPFTWGFVMNIRLPVRLKWAHMANKFKQYLSPPFIVPSLPGGVKRVEWHEWPVFVKKQVLLFQP